MTRSGRPEDNSKAIAFQKVINYLEDCDEQVTITDLILKMDEFLNSTGEAYSHKYMKQRILCHFKDRIIISGVDGLVNIVTLRETADVLLRQFYQTPRNVDVELEKIRLIEMAGKLVSSDIKSIIADKNVYSSHNDMSSRDGNLDYLPTSLRCLLNQVFKQSLKTASIGQAIMQAARPRDLIVPLQLGLGIQMHHQFSSRFLVDSLNHHGFCSSYTEVQKYERSAAVHQRMEISDYTSDHFMQYVADNVDHNTCTLDGTGTFHDMGIIAAVTPGIKTCKPVPRISVSSKDIAACGRINICAWEPKKDVSNWKYEIVRSMQCNQTYDPFDLLWKASCLYKPPMSSSWSGMMQAIHNGDHPGKSSVHFLPMIDMNPSDPNCVYSTLKFICEQAKRYNITPIVTFDQPLWWKAFTIINGDADSSELQSVVLRLGGLHIMMSFLGCVGHIMAQSGLQELLGTIYADNAVVHMLTGKAISRAIRAHVLLDSALNTKLFASMLGTPLPTAVNPQQEFADSGHTGDLDTQYQVNDDENHKKK